MAKAIKTIKVKIHNPNSGKEEALHSTVNILNKVLATYMDLILANNHLLSKQKKYVSKKTGKVNTRKFTSQELMGDIEKISFPTALHPNPQIDVHTLYPSLPAYFRRSAINTSLGMCKSYLTSRENWKKQAKENKSENPPSPPTPIKSNSFGQVVITKDPLGNYYACFTLEKQEPKKHGTDYCSESPLIAIDPNHKNSFVGFDGVNSIELARCYVQMLKEWRLAQLQRFPAFEFERRDITQFDTLKELFQQHNFNAVMNLAARAGVRASVENPWVYIETNIKGTLNLLDGLR